MKAFMRRNGVLLCASTTLYLLGLVAGLLLPGIVDLSGQTSTVTSIDFVRHNGLVLLLLIAGFFTFGIETAVLLTGNGLFVGMAVVAYIEEHSFLTVLVALLPHGIFELPAMFLAGVVGLKSAQWCIATVWGHTLPKIGQDCMVGCASAFGLILLAAPVEAYITPWLMRIV
ncbi:MAG: stage II sporulation protein M [Chloroflexaceae bacterium]|jgi:stage II sporulation protein M